MNLQDILNNQGSSSCCASCVDDVPVPKNKKKKVKRGVDSVDDPEGEFNITPLQPSALCTLREGRYKSVSEIGLQIKRLILYTFDCISRDPRFNPP